MISVLDSEAVGVCESDSDSVTVSYESVICSVKDRDLDRVRSSDFETVRDMEMDLDCCGDSFDRDTVTFSDRVIEGLSVMDGDRVCVGVGDEVAELRVSVSEGVCPWREFVFVPAAPT